MLSLDGKKNQEILTPLHYQIGNIHVITILGIFKWALKLHNRDSFLSKSDFTTSPFIIIPACGRIMITNFTSMLMLRRSIKIWDGKWQNRFKENSSFPTIQTNNICDLCMWWYLALHRKGLQIYSQVSIKQASSLNYSEEIFHSARTY